MQIDHCVFFYTLSFFISMESPTMRLKPLQSALFAVIAAGAVAVAHADTVIDNANGYTLNAKGDIVQFASLAFDDQGRILAEICCA